MRSSLFDVVNIFRLLPANDSECALASRARINEVKFFVWTQENLATSTVPSGIIAKT
jgi:hypothetical protein